uniref:N-acetylgalactosamine kinase-like n=1 Tax=Diabrotica virgifera virgifera TaxID=50390 RepID=A0A6P7GEI0_DIAVI
MTGFDVVPVRELPDSSRCKELINVFTNIYKNKPSFCVRVPGRVNLIGEHIDYCGYSVCPMALDQDILVAVSVQNDKKLQLHNTDPKFEDFECEIDNFEISLGEGAPQWYKYFLCGVKGILDTLPNEIETKGLKLVVSGNVPLRAGLSSSSALVSAAALATAHSHGSVNFCSDSITTFENTISTLTNKIKEIEKLTKENLNLRDEVKFLNSRVDTLEQQLRANDVEICGVPFKDNENVLKIVSEIGSAIDLPITE